MKERNGAAQEGDFRNDLLHGHGRITYVNGDCYDGDFVDGKEKGEGKFVWADGKE